MAILQVNQLYRYFFELIGFVSFCTTLIVLEVAWHKFLHQRLFAVKKKRARRRRPQVYPQFGYVYPQMAKQFKIVTCSIPEELHIRLKEAQQYTEAQSTNLFVRKMIEVYTNDLLAEKSGIPEKSSGIPESESKPEKGIPGNWFR